MNKLSEYVNSRKEEYWEKQEKRGVCEYVVGKKEKKKGDLWLVTCVRVCVEGKIIYKKKYMKGREGKEKEKEWEDKFYHKIKQKYYQWQSYMYCG